MGFLGAEEAFCFVDGGIASEAGFGLGGAGESVEEGDVGETEEGTREATGEAGWLRMFLRLISAD